LLDGRTATLHWAYGPTFRKNYPRITLQLEKALIATGTRNEFLMSGASSSWPSLILHLIARTVGATAAQAVANFYAFQVHRDGMAPFVAFHPDRDHGDGAIETIQTWLDTNYAVANPVEEMMRRAELGQRTFERRFKAATGYRPLEYVQLLRVTEAKRRLERTGEAIDTISWRVGYEDAAFFRRLFKRVTHVTPGAYRRQFRLPDAVIRGAAG
jgi:transcriptional regulator GlxA family with amidase domain